MKNTLKNGLGYIVGVVITIVALAIWRNEPIDWQLMFGMLLGGFIGLVIISGIKIYIKNAKEKAKE
jgi:drug/metabolite transporter (DMT)-like permease